MRKVFLLAAMLLVPLAAFGQNTYKDAYGFHIYGDQLYLQCRAMSGTWTCEEGGTSCVGSSGAANTELTGDNVIQLLTTAGEYRRYEVDGTVTITADAFARKRVVGEDDPKTDLLAATSGSAIWLCNDGDISTAKILQDGLGNETALKLVDSTLDHASNNEIALEVAYTANKAGGNDTGLRITRTDTASPGTSLLIDANEGASSVFSVDEDGKIVAYNDNATPGTDVMLELTNDGGGVRFDLVDALNSVTWVTQNQAGVYEITKAGTSETELSIDGTGNVTPFGDINITAGETVDYGATDTSLYNDGTNNWICVSEGGTCDGYVYAARYAISTGAMVRASGGNVRFRNHADTDNVTVWANVFQATTQIEVQSFRPAAGSGIVLASIGYSGIFSNTLTFDYTDLAVAATTNDVLLMTLDSKTALHSILLVVVTQGAMAADTYEISIGSAGADYDQLVLDSDAEAVAGTIYGDVDGERGTDLPDADMMGFKLYDYAGTQTIYIHADSNATDLDQASAGEWKVVIQYSGVA